MIKRQLDLFWIITLSTIFRILKKIVRNKGNSILVIQLVALGDMINASSFFRELSLNTNQHVVVLCHQGFYSLYAKNNPYANEFILFKDKHRSFLGKLIFFWDIYSRFSFVSAYDLTGSYFSKWISFSTNSDIVHGIDLRKSGFNYLYDYCNPYFSDQHIVKNYFDLLHHSGYKTDSMALEFWQDTPDNSISAGDFVAISIGAGWKMREWTDQGFAAVINHIFHRYKLKSVLLGNQDDIAKSHRITSACEDGSVLSMVGKTSIFEAASYLEKSKFVVANDSGLMHIAACYQKTIFALFGPGNETMWAPFTANAHIIRSGICTPCGNISSCKNNACMKELSPEIVIQIIDTSISV